MKATIHATQRLESRARDIIQDINRQELLDKVSLYGNSPRHYRKNNPTLYNYLISKIGKCRAKVYRGYVFIYTHEKKLVTVYPIPNWIVCEEEKIFC